MAVMGKVVEAHVSIPRDWVDFLEGDNGIVDKLEDLTQEQWNKILSFAVGYCNFDDENVKTEIKIEAGIE
jgi:hypothetical protein